MEMSNNIQRITYIDSLRGLAIIFIVMGHVMNLSLDYHGPCFFSCSAIPLFFFISGYVFRIKKTKLIDQLVSLRTKVPILVIFPSIIYIVGSLYKCQSIGSGLFTNYKNGYWFTFVLFAFLCIYVSCYAILPRFKRYNLLTIVSLIVGCIFYLAKTRWYIVEHLGTPASLFSIELWQYFIWFVIGIEFRKYNILKRISENALTKSIVIITFLITNFFYGELRNVVGGTLLDFFMILSSIITYSIFIINYEGKEIRCVDKTLQFLGKRTLDIYLLHYFFIPYGLKNYSLDFINEDYCHQLGWGATLIIASLVIFASIVLGMILRLSPFVNKYMFGSKV